MSPAKGKRDIVIFINPLISSFQSPGLLLLLLDLHLDDFRTAGIVGRLARTATNAAYQVLSRQLVPLQLALVTLDVLLGGVVLPVFNFD